MLGFIALSEKALSEIGAPGGTVPDPVEGGAPGTAEFSGASEISVSSSSAASIKATLSSSTTIAVTSSSAGKVKVSAESAQTITVTSSATVTADSPALPDAVFSGATPVSVASEADASVAYPDAELSAGTVISVASVAESTAADLSAEFFAGTIIEIASHSEAAADIAASMLATVVITSAATMRFGMRDFTDDVSALTLAQAVAARTLQRGAHHITATPQATAITQQAVVSAVD